MMVGDFSGIFMVRGLRDYCLLRTPDQSQAVNLFFFLFCAMLFVFFSR